MTVDDADITGRDRSPTSQQALGTAEAITQQEQQFREILEYCPAGLVIVDEDGRLLFHNARLRELLGYSAEELDGFDTRLFWSDLDHRTRIVEMLHEQGGQLVNEEVTWRTKHGRPLRMLMSYVQVAYGGGHVSFAGGKRLAWVYDITQLAQREVQIAQQEHQLRDMVEYCPAGLVVVDEDGRLLFHNARIRELLGYDAEELQLFDTRRLWSDLEHRARIVDLLHERGGRLMNEEVVWTTKAGQPLRLLLSYVQVAYQGGHVSFSGAKRLGWVYDITRLRQAEQARLLSERRLAQAVESISEGFSLYDAQDRLVICNSRYRDDLYAGISDVMQPGIPFESVIRAAAERERIEGAREDPEILIANRLAKHRTPRGPHLQQQSDGRWIQISERKTEDGGTVAVYSDVTELIEHEQALAEKSKALEQLSNQLAKYLSPQVYDSIFSGRQEVKVASSRKKLTVFFSDIVGFTEITDKMESEELTQLLNHYLTEMSRIALDHGATIDKYVGDAILAFFGDPESRGVKEDALACVRMALAMQERITELARDWRDMGIETPLSSRIGIHTGYCTVGNFGSEDRMDYTIIGGAVNLASRLEHAAPPGGILVSYDTYAHVKEAVACEERGQIQVRGIAYPVATYAVTGLRAAARQSPTGAKISWAAMVADDPLRFTEAERRAAAASLSDAIERLRRSNAAADGPDAPREGE